MRYGVLDTGFFRVLHENVKKDSRGYNPKFIGLVGTRLKNAKKHFALDGYFLTSEVFDEMSFLSVYSNDFHSKLVDYGDGGLIRLLDPFNSKYLEFIRTLYRECYVNSQDSTKPNYRISIADASIIAFIVKHSRFSEFNSYEEFEALLRSEDFFKFLRNSLGNKYFIFTTDSDFIHLLSKGGIPSYIHLVGASY